jgi:cytochrome o ubiquinol oxidase subunit 1
MVILAGVGFQLLQIFVSIRQRNQNRDLTGDAWGDGRTLEWATSSPAPEYNFAHTPPAPGRDAFWQMKQSKTVDVPSVYEPIKVPKNTGFAPIIALFAALFGFGFIWHIWWLAAICLAAIVVCILLRSNDEHTERTISARMVEKTEAARL